MVPYDCLYPHICWIKCNVPLVLSHLAGNSVQTGKTPSNSSSLLVTLMPAVSDHCEPRGFVGSDYVLIGGLRPLRPQRAINDDKIAINI